MRNVRACAVLACAGPTIGEVYDTEQLRTFLTVAQLLSFSRAAELLGIGQPTASQHVRKLERALGRSLFVRDTRSVSLTDDGEAMVGFARAILTAQEAARAHFTGEGLSGRLRMGVTDDLARAPLPRNLREYREMYPRVDLQLTVAQNDTLHQRLSAGHLDIAFVKHTAGEGTGRVLRRERLVWTAYPRMTIDHDAPVPLVMYESPSISRSMATAALERANRSYRVTCTVRGFNGVIAATQAGLGIAVFPLGLLPSELTVLPDSLALPPIGEIELVLLTRSGATSAAAEALIEAIMSPKLRSAPLVTGSTVSQLPAEADGA